MTRPSSRTVSKNFHRDNMTERQVALAWIDRPPLSASKYLLNFWNPSTSYGDIPKSDSKSQTFWLVKNLYPEFLPPPQKKKLLLSENVLFKI